MKGIAFTVATTVFVGLLGYGGYFALSNLSDPKSYVPKDFEKIGDLHDVVTEPEVPGSGAPEAAAPAVPPPAAQGATSTAPSTAAPGDLSSRLSAMADAKTVLKKGSKGASVGLVQQFMNRYFKKSSKIDNDFGATLESNVRKFQSQNKISQTGQVGSSTLRAMVTWLGRNP